MMEKMRNSKKKKGFTLIELIVVIAILGILAAIAIPRFSGTLTTSKVKADQATARTIVAAVSLAQANNATFAVPGRPTTTELQSAGYLATVPKSAQLTAPTDFTITWSADWTISGISVTGAGTANVYP